MRIHGNALSAEYVRQLGTEELCQWLREYSRLCARKLDVALKVIGEQFMDGANFLECTYEMWVTRPLNLPGGVALSLAQIAQTVLGSAANAHKSKGLHLMCC
jgi:hypothetical protein